MRFSSLAVLPLVALATLPALSFACAPAIAPERSPSTTAATAPKVDPAQGTPGPPLAWERFDAPLFARARAEHRYVILDGSAEWCHWCHVMEATTYHDPAVREAIGRSFLAAKV